MTHRANEEDGVHFRSDRVFSANGQWFFQVRETPKPVGPFQTKALAHKALEGFASDMKEKRSVAEALTHVRIISDLYTEDDF